MAGERFPQPVILFDGVCGLCNGAVRFVLRHDPAGRFRFAPLQSEFARTALDRHGADPSELSTVCLLLEPGTPRERLLAGSDAVLAAARELGGPWSLLALGRILPRALRDRAYRAVARNRYRWFGRYEACPLPGPDVRDRFIELGAAAEPARQRASGR
jgi:predicted DCC family thiol-disulfide oxidoreductase YuxK